MPGTCGFALEIWNSWAAFGYFFTHGISTFPHAYSLFTQRIAWAALGDRLPMPDVEAFSKEMKMSTVSGALTYVITDPMHVWAD
jgi:hypothetical protein